MVYFFGTTRLVIRDGPEKSRPTAKIAKHSMNIFSFNFAAAFRRTLHAAKTYGNKIPFVTITTRTRTNTRVHNNLPSDTKYNPNPNPNPTTKQHAEVRIQLNTVACPTYPDKLIRNMLLYRLCDFRL